MTTDITELAQREKFEAWWERTQHNGNPPRFGWSHWRDGEGYKVDDDDSELEGMWSAWKAAGAELVEALEKAQQRITQMESRTVTDWIEHDGKWRPESLGLDELVYLKTRKQELKIPYPAGKVKGWMNTGGDMDVMAYKLASPQASTVTVKLPDEVDVLLNHLEDVLPFEVFQLIDAHKWNAVSRLSAAGIKVEAE
ncbi:hypothetical protein [Klebsiella pneumoniae]|uniref:hypothetical protein n=1 Tax=Klebsiella pneumoniae TaxID=573 RepID=UPI003B67320A